MSNIPDPMSNLLILCLFIRIIVWLLLHRLDSVSKRVGAEARLRIVELDLLSSDWIPYSVSVCTETVSLVRGCFSPLFLSVACDLFREKSGGIIPPIRGYESVVFAGYSSRS